MGESGEHVRNRWRQLRRWPTLMGGGNKAHGSSQTAVGVTVGRPGTAADISQESKERVAWNMTPYEDKKVQQRMQEMGDQRKKGYN